MRAGLSRRRLLGAGVVGAGAVFVAPRRSLLAVARGLDRPLGLWSVVTDPRTGALVGLLDAGRGPEVRRLEVDGEGTVRVGPHLLDPAGMEPIAVGTDHRHPLVLASRAVDPGPVPRPRAEATAVAALLSAEPFGPHGSLDTPPASVEHRAAIRDLASGVELPVPTHGLVSAASGPWSIHQHGPDDEADHLPMLSVVAGGERRVVFDDLGLAGVAQLSGPPAAPVLTVVDETRTLHVRRLPAGPTVSLADDAAVAVTATEHDIYATRRARDGLLVIDRLDGARWRPHQPVPGSDAATAVIPVGGSSAFVATGPTVARLVPVEGGR